MTVRVYLRRSKGDEHQHYSLDVQRDGARRFLTEHLGAQGLSFDWDERVEYVDDDRSRTDFEGREALIKLRHDVQEGDVVICRDQSRLGGDALEVTVVVRDLVQRRRARLFYYADRQEVPYASVMDAAATFMRGFGSQMEVEAIRSRTKEALRARVRLGRLAGGRCFGYRNVRHGGDGASGYTVAVVDEQQAEVVREVFKLARAGRGFKSIAAELNAAGCVNGRGEPWTDGAIRTLLTCDRYRGVYVHGRINRTRTGGRRIAHRAKPDEVMFIEVPEWRIVDDLTWHAVQARFKQRERGPRAIGPATKYALSGIARCASCQGAIGAASRTVISVNGVRSHIPAYSCIAHRTKRACAVSTAQRIDEVEGAVADYVQGHVLTPALVNKLLGGLREEVEQQTGGPRSDVPEMEQRLQRLKAEQRNLARAVATGGETIPELLDELRSRQRRIEELQIAIETAKRTPATVAEVLEKVEAVVRAKLGDLRAALAGDPAGARDVYAALFPEGLSFTPVTVGKARGPARARRVWAVKGTAEIGVCNFVVTPPGMLPNCKVRIPVEFVTLRDVA